MYQDDIPRVSSIVEYFFPFKWTDWEKRYNEWLDNHWIDRKEYIKWACDMWTEVHKAMEEYLLWVPLSPYSADVDIEVQNWTKWLSQLDATETQTEVYVREKNNLFQWTVDFIYKQGDKYIIADFKTWWIVKKRYWLPNKFEIDKKKKDKVQLQMSVYAYRLELDISEIELIFIHMRGVKTLRLPIITKDKISSLINDYHMRNTYITF